MNFDTQISGYNGETYTKGIVGTLDDERAFVNGASQIRCDILFNREWLIREWYQKPAHFEDAEDFPQWYDFLKSVTPREPYFDKGELRDWTPVQFYNTKWQPRSIEQSKICLLLDHGESVALGGFQPDTTGKTKRRASLQRTATGILLDVDKGIPPAIVTCTDLIQAVPFLRYATGLRESVSSRSERKGGLSQFRAFFGLEQPIPVDCERNKIAVRTREKLGEWLAVQSRYAPTGGAKNAVCVGYGNAGTLSKYDSDYLISDTFVQEMMQEAATEIAAETREKEKRETRRKQNGKRRDGIQGDARSPIEAFIEDEDPIRYMERQGWITHLQGSEYRWHESSSQRRSCLIENGIVKPFSASLQAVSPADEKPVNAHRFIIYYETQLDISQEGDRPEIRKRLADRGYGMSFEVFKRQHLPIPPPTRTRYTINTEHKHATSDMDTERTENQNVIVWWLRDTKPKRGKHLLILGSAAGSGKTTLSTATADTLLYIAKTTEEADKIFEELDKRDEDAIRHRPRLFNRGHKDIHGNNDWETLPLGLGEQERPCIQPELCNLHAERIGTTNYICKQCPFYTECKVDGYLSQAEKERNTSKVIYAWDEVMACDERFADRVKRICAKDDILILDEVNPLALTQARQLDRDTLLDLTERFRHFHESPADTFKFLEKLCDLISTAKTPENFIAGVKEWLDSIEDIKALDEKLEKYPIGVTIRNTPENATHETPFEATLLYQNQEVTVPVVDFQTADDTPAFFVDPDTPIETDTYQVLFVPLGFLLKVGLAALDDPPRRHRKMLSDLKTFIDENANIETAPFTFDPKNQTFEYHLKPSLNHRRTIFNTASDPDNLIGEAYRDTDINITRHTGTPPDWKTDLVFQIASGAYLPRQSLIAKDGKKLALKRFAEDMIESFIKPSMKSGLKTLVIAPKVFQEVDSVISWAVTETDDYIPSQNAILTNHHRAEGRNDYQDCDIVFEFHYEPNHHEIQADAKHIYRNPEIPLDFTREKRTVTIGGVSFEKNVYIDDRVQAVYNRECRARLMQGSMRLRPNIHKGKIIVYLTAEPIDIPVTPVAFTPADKKKFNGDWTGFKKQLEATPKERIAAGESKSKAYRDSDTHKKETADRDAKVLALHQQGVNKSQIHRETGVPRKTVTDIIFRYDKGGGENSQSTISNSYSRMGKSATTTPLDDTGIESKTLHKDEVQPDHDTFFKLLDINTCFYGKQQLSPSEVSQYTGIDESEVREILGDWYQKVVISPGIGDKYWMTERDKKNLWDKILAPTHRSWEQNFPGQKILCPPTLFNPNLNANASEY